MSRARRIDEQASSSSLLSEKHRKEITSTTTAQKDNKLPELLNGKLQAISQVKLQEKILSMREKSLNPLQNLCNLVNVRRLFHTFPALQFEVEYVDKDEKDFFLR